MADPLLTPAEFAQQIKVKYPVYASVAGDELATKMLAAGQNVTRDFTKGVKSGMPDLTSVMAQVAATVSGARPGAGARGRA